MTTLCLSGPSERLAYVLRLADDQLVLGHRLSEWTGHAPMLEEDIALANIALDHIGAARSLYGRACEIHAGGEAGDPITEDDLAFRREGRDFFNCLLVERPNGDFAHTVVRQFFFCACSLPLWEALTGSADATLAAIAAKSAKEARYHLRHAGDWFVRLGDGTQESHRRMASAVTELWPYTGELFEADAVTAAMVEAGVAADPEPLAASWRATLEAGFAAAGLAMPQDAGTRTGGRTGRHGEPLAALLGEMQSVHRAHPGATW